MLLVAGCVAAAASPAAAQVAPQRFNPAAPENRQLLASFSYASVEPVLASIGARYRRTGTAANQPALMVDFPNRRRALLTFGSCNPDGSACKALAIQSYWTKIANSPATRVAQAIETFNQRYSFAKAYVASDGRPVLQRYLTADYGYVRGNLAVNLLVFANQAEQFAVQILAPLETPAR